MTQARFSLSLTHYAALLFITEIWVPNDWGKDLTICGVCVAREILLIYGWLFPSLRLLLKYLIFICYFISDPAEKNCPKRTVFMLAESSPRAWLYRKNRQTIKASRAKNWGAGICCVTSLPQPFSSSSSFGL